MNKLIFTTFKAKQMHRYSSARRLRSPRNTFPKCEGSIFERRASSVTVQPCTLRSAFNLPTM